MWGKRILANSRARESARLVMVALAEACDAKGFVAVTVPELANWCISSERQVQRDLRALVELGELQLVAKGGGRGRPTRYRILIQWSARFWTRKQRLKGDIHERGLARLNGAR